jgi:WD40 repeat protein
VGTRGSEIIEIGGNG